MELVGIHSLAVKHFLFFCKIYHCFAFILLLRDGFSCKIHHCFCFHFLAEGWLWFLTFLLLLPKCWDCRCMSPGSVFYFLFLFFFEKCMLVVCSLLLWEFLNITFILCVCPRMCGRHLYLVNHLIGPKILFRKEHKIPYMSDIWSATELLTPYSLECSLLPTPHHRLRMTD